MKIIVTCLLTLCFNSLAVASRLTPLPISTLEENSKLIIIAKIKNIKLIKDSGRGGKRYKIDVEKISTLKGNKDVKNITFKFHKGGLNGFNIIPKENTFWIMFLRQINNNNGVLVHPRSMVKFAAYIRESGTVYRPNPVTAVVTPKVVDVKPKVAALVVQPKKPSSGHSLDNITPYIVHLAHMIGGRNTQMLLAAANGEKVVESSARESLQTELTKHWTANMGLRDGSLDIDSAVFVDITSYEFHNQ